MVFLGIEILISHLPHLHQILLLRHINFGVFGLFGDINMVESIVNNLVMDFILLTQVLCKNLFYFKKPRAKFLINSHFELQK